MLTAHDVLNQKFAATKFREGYDQDEVDDFLDRVRLTLLDLESGVRSPEAVTADEVGAVRFQATKFRQGYDQAEVDRFLDRVREQLAAATPEDAPVRQASVAPGAPAVSATALVLRVQTAHSTRLPGAPDAVTVRLPDGQVRPVVDVRSTPTGVELILG